VLCADDDLDKVQQFVDIVNQYGSRLTAEEQWQRAGTDELTVGQQVLARSSVNGYWYNAVVTLAGHR